jgi:Papain-like cysteine protease AvrRpt2/Putative peptidoglycan binding domain
MLILRRGSTGPEVSNLQNLLNAKLRPSPPLAVDGKFGPKTDKAVRQYQDDNWLVVDGLVGPCTIAALKGTEKYVILHRVTLIPQPSDTTCWAASTAMVLGQSVNSIIARNRSLGLTDSTDGQPNDSNLQQPENMEKFAAANGFGVLYGQSWTASGLAAELRARGPLWINLLWDPAGYTTRDPANPSRYLGSSGHIVVLAGMRGDGTEIGSTMRIYNPWPPGRGDVRSFGYFKWMSDHLTGTYLILYRRPLTSFP